MERLRDCSVRSQLPQTTLRRRFRLFIMCGVLIATGALPTFVIAADTTSALADAVEQRNAARVEQLLADGADANQTQVDGMTPLLWAVHGNHEQWVQQLLEAGANPNQANQFDVTPLSVACENGNPQIVAALLKAGANAQSTLPGGETALHTAARTGQVEVLRLLISQQADVDAREAKQQTPIMWASEAGHTQAVQILVDAEADWQAPLKSGFTPFLFAVREGHRELVSYFLSLGEIDIDATMEPKRSFSKRPRDGTTALILAIENGHFDLANDLLSAGADPNLQSSGFTPLHVLTWVRKPNRGDGADGDPAPIGSGKMTSLEMIDALIAHGANANQTLRSGKGGRGRLGHKGATALLFAAKTADLPMIKRLVAHGADPHLPNADRCTPLMAAAGIGTIAPTEEAGTEEEALAVVDYLLERGADVNHVDRNRETAMHGAAYKSLPRMVARLDAAGADATIWTTQNKYKWSPVMIAEGHRVGNFKPSFETLAAIHQVMESHGLTPPAPTPRKKRKGYEK